MSQKDNVTASNYWMQKTAKDHFPPTGKFLPAQVNLPPSDTFHCSSFHWMDTRHILDLPWTGQIGPPRAARRHSADKLLRLRLILSGGRPQFQSRMPQVNTRESLTSQMCRPHTGSRMPKVKDTNIDRTREDHQGWNLQHLIRD